MKILANTQNDTSLKINFIWFNLEEGYL